MILKPNQTGQGPRTNPIKIPKIDHMAVMMSLDNVNRGRRVTKVQLLKNNIGISSLLILLCLPNFEK